MVPLHKNLREPTRDICARVSLSDHAHPRCQVGFAHKRLQG